MRKSKRESFYHKIPEAPYTDAEGYVRYPMAVVSVSAMTFRGAVDRVLNWVKTEQHHYVNVCTADTMVHCYDDPDHAAIVENSGMATTDGMPLMIQGKWRGYDVTRVYGPDLMLAVCEQGIKAGVSHFFYGATDGVLAKLKANLLEKFPELNIAGMYSPPFRPLSETEEDDVVRMINDSGAQVVWCGLGTPKQDYWVAKFCPKLKANALLAVGAAFNFHAGEVTQAPRWMMRCSLEWLFRLLVEPKRLWRRYLIGNPRFVLMCVEQWLRENRRRRG